MTNLTNYEDAASTPAAVFAGYCQTGGSGQVESGGFSIINGDQFCEHIRMADRALLAYQQQVEWCKPRCSNCGKKQPVNYACSQQMMDYHLEVYRENMIDANNLVQTSQATGWINRVFGQLAVPIGVIAFLLL